MIVVADEAEAVHPFGEEKAFVAIICRTEIDLDVKLTGQAAVEVKVNVIVRAEVS